MTMSSHCRMLLGADLFVTNRDAMIEHAYTLGGSLSEIATAVGLGRSQVHRILMKRNIQRRPVGQPKYATEGLTK